MSSELKYRDLTHHDSKHHDTKLSDPKASDPKYSERKLGKLLLIPTPLQGQTLESSLGEQSRNLISNLEFFIVENAKSARAFLKLLGTALPLQQLKLEELNEHTAEGELERLLSPILQGNDCGLLSDTGAPCLADPGANLVAMAHSLGIQVSPIVGPSAVMLAIISSGLNGQNFSFIGYLPAKSPDKEIRIKEIERTSKEKQQSQFFIETPYRAAKLFSTLLQNCKPETKLSLSINIGSAEAYSNMRSVQKWKDLGVPNIDNQLVVVGLQA